MPRIVAAHNETRRDLILKKAAMLYRSKGFAATSMRELAENIGVEAASLYNHIGSKSELLELICFKVADAFMDHLNKLETSPQGVVYKLKELIRFHIEMMQEHYDEVFVANHEWKQLKEPELSVFLNRRRTYENKLTELISSGVKEGSLKKLDPGVVTFTLLSAVRGLEFWKNHKRQINKEELEDNMIIHLFEGIINQ
jgi:AcrR family transcriptional regulator